MGVPTSTMETGLLEQGETGHKEPSETDSHNQPTMEGSHTIDKLRWADLMHALQSIEILQTAATMARIEARQKTREASFKRQDVWVWDAKFMGEIQRLNAQGNLKGFEELSRLATQCQTARDLLGPVEQDNIEAESYWLGQVWKLKEAEKDFYTEFKDEFRDAAEYVTTHGGESVSSYHPYSDSDSQIADGPVMEDDDAQTEDATVPLTELDHAEVEEQIPLNLEDANAQEFENTAVLSDLDSGFGDIESILSTSPPFDINKYGQPRTVPEAGHTGIELYHDLLVDFSTRRARINKWLKNIVLESRLEGLSVYSILQDLLAVENQEVPSNWAQLVIAWWEFDEASAPVPVEKGTGNTAAEETDPVRDSSKDRAKNKTSTIPDIQSRVLSDLLSESHIEPPKSDGDRGNNSFNGKGLAPPTPIPPSPPFSHPNSRSASRDTREAETSTL
ncbi:uncharacterized protein LY89DRAFT_789931 [Mollisia scopiformis]|uniref:Uncharacterized protein n=1 Tax=Mollisia scopiformis TaxID=149040 RepID=A0A132B425_MOLSC|nr:uncharacterized protein LY89DRAFT_789931 [Mollisia scopiformis]KUJ07136.1 hypothetical protein LY89DRAFT_789931 [Mollisia scopiformis]